MPSLSKRLARTKINLAVAKSVVRSKKKKMKQENATGVKASNARRELQSLEKGAEFIKQHRDTLESLAAEQDPTA